MSIILSAWTIIVFVLFIAIGIWAWSSKNKEKFEAAARIPFEEDDEPVPDNKELDNG